MQQEKDERRGEHRTLNIEVLEDEDEANAQTAIRAVPCYLGLCPDALKCGVIFSLGHRPRDQKKKREMPCRGYI